MLKRFNFFVTEETRLDHEASGSGADKSKNEIGTLTRAAGGASRFLLVANNQGKILAVNRKMHVAGQVAAHTRQVDILKQLSSRPLAITIGDGPIAKNSKESTGGKSLASDATTLDITIKFWSITADTSVDHETLQAEERADLSLVRSFKLGAVLARERSRPRWAVSDPAQMGANFTWPRLTCAEVTEDLTQMALGFSDGHVVLIRSDPHGAGPLLSNLVELATSRGHTSAGSASTDAKHSLLHERGHLYTTIQTAADASSMPSVTGLGFCRTDADGLHLWVATERNLRAYRTNATQAGASGATRRSSFSGKNARLGEVEPGPELDADGCALNCCCLAYPLPPAPTIGAQVSFLSLPLDAEPGALDAEDRAALNEDATRRQTEFVIAKGDHVEFFSHEDPRAVYAVAGQKRLLTWFRNCLVVVTHGKPGLASTQAPRAGPAADSSAPPDVVHLYDFRNKFIAASLTLRGSESGQVLAVTNQWNRLVVLTTTRRAYMLKEKDTQTKLDDLLRRNLYATALSLARSSGVDDAQVMDIHRMYGDHLYAKGSFDDSIVQYCQTIGRLEPSYVIRRFLDSQRLENLISYLEALHTSTVQAPTGDHTTLLLNCYTKQKMEDKLEKFVSNQAITAAIDVHAAVAVLRTARYFDLAIQLAKEHAEHALCLRILLEETDQHEQALAYLRDLPVSIANSHLQAYGKSLMRKLPDATTAAIQQMCCSPQEWGAGSASSESPTSRTAQAEAPHPEEFIHIFVDHREHLGRFLEAVVDQDGGRTATPAIWNTYLELLLAPGDGGAKRSETAEQQAMSVLKNSSASYDPHHALVLVQSAGFQRGLLYLYERLHMYHMLIRHYMKVGDSAAILANCKAYGAKDPNLWVQVLKHFAAQYEAPEGGDDASESERRKAAAVERDLQEVLKQIERFRILPPLVVVETLSSNPEIRLHMIRPYIRSQLDVSQRQIDELAHDIQHLRKDTASMKREADELRSHPKVFTNSKCNWTGAPLELPTVHFLSGNSYNLSSLPGGGPAADTAAAATAHTQGPAPHDRMLEDPECVAEQHAVADIMHKLRQNAEHVDEEFFNQLEIAPDGFSAVAEYFSKCLFEPPQE
ncbi:Vacuolar protein sorting-associated protein 11-like [Hondaea fermentalgiana]|uniref:Vacuolar protein sorting-associated protein 11-like n=1 Tax=Hondaea fermentalgiana TaxID=2315210 RepID=A0A2R5G084_9STRA|nr:Vacuolar protein sorting-associated protein 11-like [Hondaea fermentalgiana]|eukprot:GBG24437.1 Vacuolar protein sorting-associated protein 11-like [Hondaea fermentalgiana]